MLLRRKKKKKTRNGQHTTWNTAFKTNSVHIPNDLLLVRVIKLRRMRQVAHVARKGQIRNV